MNMLSERLLLGGQVLFEPIWVLLFRLSKVKSKQGVKIWLY